MLEPLSVKGSRPAAGSKAQVTVPAIRPCSPPGRRHSMPPAAPGRRAGCPTPFQATARPGLRRPPGQAGAGFAGLGLTASRCWHRARLSPARRRLQINTPSSRLITDTQVSEPAPVSCRGSLFAGRPSGQGRSVHEAAGSANHFGRSAHFPGGVVEERHPLAQAQQAGKLPPGRPWRAAVMRPQGGRRCLRLPAGPATVSQKLFHNPRPPMNQHPRSSMAPVTATSWARCIENRRQLETGNAG